MLLNNNKAITYLFLILFKQFFLKSIVLKLFYKKTINKLKKKKKLHYKFMELKLEKIFFKSLQLKTSVNFKNIFKMFQVKKKLKIPKRSVFWRN
jgi:hypothetical protein